MCQSRVSFSFAAPLGGRNSGSRSRCSRPNRIRTIVNDLVNAERGCADTTTRTGRHQTNDIRMFQPCRPKSFFLCSLPQTTALDKERQVFRRRRHQDVKSTTARAPHGTFLSKPLAGPSLTPAEFTSESEDYSPSSAETVRSPTSPF